MGLKIRMSRAGTTNHAYYRIVVADSRSPRDGRYLNVLVRTTRFCRANIKIALC